MEPRTIATASAARPAAASAAGPETASAARPVSPSAPGLAIGAVSKATGISVRAIRHYDALGLLTSARAANGYRQFHADAVTQVKQIQRLLKVGFSLEDIQSFPVCMLMEEGAAPCAETARTQRKRLAAIEDQIADLQRRRHALLTLLGQPCISR